MELHNLEYTKGSRGQKTKRVGRGHGSGMGKTSTRGQDGQKSRKSVHTRLSFEGGQTPLYRRVPKVGFNNINFANEYNVVSLKTLETLNVSEITKEVLIQKRIINNNKLPIKIIGNIKISKKYKICAHKFSKGALAALKAANCEIEILK